MELIIVIILDSLIMQQINQKQQIVKQLYCFLKEHGRLECNIIITNFRLATKDIEVG